MINSKQVAKESVISFIIFIYQKRKRPMQAIRKSISILRNNLVLRLH